MSDLSMELYGCEEPFPFKLYKKNQSYKVQMPCRRCESCKLRKKKQWTGRIIAESFLHEQSAFITLTYKNDCLPDDIQTGYRDVQLWLKRLRKNSTETVTYFDGSKYTVNLPSKFRYFVAGEHGPNATHRLHWHLILFGMPAFPKGKVESESWKNGFVTWEPATVSRMHYVACYSVKKTGQHLNFFQCSRRPGLGTDWFYRLGRSVARRGKLPHDIRCLEAGKSKWPLDKTARAHLRKGFVHQSLQDGNTDAVIEMTRKDAEVLDQLELDSSLYNLVKQPNGKT